MSDDLDRLLTEPLLLTPRDFTDRVMRRLARQPLPEPRLRTWLRWLAVAGAGIPVATHVLPFVFAMWTASAAG